MPQWFSGASKSAGAEKGPTPRQEEITQEIANIQAKLQEMERQVTESGTDATLEKRRELEAQILELRKQSAQSGW